MQLRTREWGAPESENRIVCIHGLTHNSFIFEEFGRRLSEAGHSVLALDLRGHGRSPSTPPWSAETHVEDVLETLDAVGVNRSILVGHSFGGRLAAAIAATGSAQIDGVVLLESPPQVPEGRALQAIELESIDWSFATIDGATNAALSSDLMVAPSQRRVEEFVAESVQRGADGRYRFAYSPDAVIAAWKEMTRPPPIIAEVPTLIVNAEVPLANPGSRDRHYEDSLEALLTIAAVPNGHNVLWEAADETIALVAEFAGSVDRAAGIQADP